MNTSFQALFYNQLDPPVAVACSIQQSRPNLGQTEILDVV